MSLGKLCPKHMFQQIWSLILVSSSFLLPKTLPIHSFSNLEVILNSMQFFFLHFKFTFNACFSYHPDKLPPFESSNNYLLAQHFLSVTAIFSSGPDGLPKKTASLRSGRTAGPVALLLGSVHLDKAPASRTVPSPGEAALSVCESKYKPPVFMFPLNHKSILMSYITRCNGIHHQNTLSTGGLLYFIAERTQTFEVCP